MGEGERLHAQRRRRFWMILSALFVLGGVAGFATGFLTALNEGTEGGSASYTTAASIGVGIFVLGGAYGSWKFFQNVDEVEIADLFASRLTFVNSRQYRSISVNLLI